MASAQTTGVTLAFRQREELLHRIMLALQVVWPFAVLVDARHHAHAGFGIETFFILEHLPLYGTWLAVSLTLGLYYVQSIRLGLPRNRRLPVGYSLAALGAALFGAGGIFDMLWHETFGFEANLEFVLSPSHLILLGGATVVTLGVLRHSLQDRAMTSRESSPSLPSALPVIIPVAALLWHVMWTTWWSDPLTADFASGGYMVSDLDAFAHVEYASAAAEVAGAVGLLWNVALVMPFVIVPLQRWRLPPGAITLTIALYVVVKAAAVGTFVYVPAFLVGAIIGDLLWTYACRAGRADDWRTYAALGATVPLTQTALYLASSWWIAGSIVWPMNVWLGVIVMSALVGAGVALLSSGAVAGTPRRGASSGEPSG